MIIWIFDLHTVTLGILVFFHIYMSPTSRHPNSWAQICSLVHPIQTRYPGLWNSVGLIHATANASNLLGGFMPNIWPQPTEARTHRLKKQSPWMFWLVVEPTHLKNMPVKMDSSSPRFGVNIPKIIWNHHPVVLVTLFPKVRNYLVSFTRCFVFAFFATRD